MTERFNYYWGAEHRNNVSDLPKLDQQKNNDLSKTLEWDESREYAYSKVEDLCARLSNLEKNPTIEQIRDVIWSVDTTKLFDKVSRSDQVVLAIISALQNNDRLEKRDISKYLGTVSMWWTIRSASKKFDMIEKAA